MRDETEPSPPVSRRKLIAFGAAASGLAFAASGAVADASTKPRPRGAALDLDRFVEDCVAANRETDAQAAVSAVLARGVANPAAMLSAVGEPKRAGLKVLHRAPELTIFAAVWTPQMNLMAHDHRMWASIGIYTGREDNILWRRTDDSIEAFGADALFEGDVADLPGDVIHSVTNPLPRFTGGIHIYGGDFFATTRDQWNPETLDREPSDGAVIRAIFDRENEKLKL